MTPQVFAEKVDAEWATIKDGPETLTEAEIERAKSFFTKPAYEALDDTNESLEQALKDDFAFKIWVGRNVKEHQQPGYAIVNLAVKETSIAPGDVTDEQLETIADLADQYSFAEIRVTHEQSPLRCKPSDTQSRLANRHHLLPGRRLLLSGQCEVDSCRRSDPTQVR
jgi:sulfite reductase (NADPH) hemoprotein beta-component